MFLPELFTLARSNDQRPLPNLVEELIAKPPREVWLALGAAFFGQKGPGAILDTIASWHHGGGQPLSTPGGQRAVEVLRKIPAWGALLPRPISAGELVVRSITDVAGLIEEGLALRHCIARYAMSCAYYGRHVLGGTTATGYRLSTAMLQLGPDGGAQLIEHRGYANSTPDPRSVSRPIPTPARPGRVQALLRSFDRLTPLPLG